MKEETRLSHFFYFSPGWSDLILKADSQKKVIGCYLDACEVLELFTIFPFWMQFWECCLRFQLLCFDSQFISTRM